MSRKLLSLCNYHRRKPLRYEVQSSLGIQTFQLGLLTLITVIYMLFEQWTTFPSYEETVSISKNVHRRKECATNLLAFLCNCVLSFIILCLIKIMLPTTTKKVNHNMGARGACTSLGSVLYFTCIII